MWCVRSMTLCVAAALFCENHTRIFRSQLMYCIRDALCWLTHFCCACKFLLIKYSSQFISSCDPFRWRVGVAKAINTQLKLMRPNVMLYFFLYIYCKNWTQQVLLVFLLTFDNTRKLILMTEHFFRRRSLSHGRPLWRCLQRSVYSERERWVTTCDTQMNR